MLKKILLCCFFLLGLFGLVQAQNKTISGKVISLDDSSPLIGVTVQVKGTNNGTQTDVDGNFKLNVAEDNAVLVFRFVGLKNLELPATANMDVRMELDQKMLSEVVVTGYTTESKERSMMSTSVVNSKLIKDVPFVDINQMLQGNAPGVMVGANSGQPGSSTNIRIRGIGSITAGTSPLYVIDGAVVQSGDISQIVRTQDPLSSINPNDIENITILKDAAATALYGSRGANGVIVVTTKSGKAGKTKVEFSAQYGFTQRLEGKVKLMNSTELLGYQRDIIKNRGGFTDSDILTLRPDFLANNSTDWVSEAYRTGKTQNYEVSISGGNEKTRYFVSGNYFKQEGILKASDFERMSIRLNLDNKFSDKFDMALRTSLAYGSQLNAGGGNTFSSPILGSFFNSPFIPARNTDGTAPDGWRGTVAGTLGYEPFAAIPANFRPTLLGGNFLYSLDRNFILNNNLRSLNNLQVGWNIADGLRLSANINADLIVITERSYRDPTTYDGGQLSGYLSESSTFSSSFLNNYNLSYRKTIAEDHNLSANLVFEYQFNDRRFVNAQGQNIASGALTVLDIAAKPAAVGGGIQQSSFVGYLAAANYDYKSKYFLGGSYRIDGSSRFAPNNRFGSFWSASGAWRISQEEFMKKVSIVDDLKLRASYGTTGNAALNSNYPFQGLYSFTPSYNNLPASVPSSPGNPNLGWEKTGMFDIGIDFSLFNRKLYGSVEYYDKRSEALLLDVPLSRTTGFSTQTRNAGSMQNNGWEIALGGVVLDKNDLRWTVDFNISTLNNKILSLTDGQTFLTNPGNGNQRLEVGRPIASWFMPEWAGVDAQTGAPQWYDKDGALTSSYAAAARRWVGKALPDYTGSITNTFAWKGLDFSFMFYFVAGGQVYNSTRSFLLSDGSRSTFNQSTDALTYWKQAGDIAENPKAVYGNGSASASTSSRFLESNNYIRLRNVRLGYNLPKSILSKIRAEKVYIYAQGQNLLTFTNYRGFDPDISTAPVGNTLTPFEQGGVEFFPYSNGKVVTFGINVGF